ncbi:MAG: DegT/DnrJ/EryC1/StrS family aminotransferase, partial [bacterium]|nr:DegT/DnrJ/EryC1/StrS family aminotransferase [bacterium]
DREDLLARLAKKNIQTRPVWFLNHWQKPYLKNQHYKIEKAIWFWQKVLNLPCSSNLTEAQVKTVATAIREAGRK